MTAEMLTAARALSAAGTAVRSMEYRIAELSTRRNRAEIKRLRAELDTLKTTAEQAASDLMVLTHDDLMVYLDALETVRAERVAA